MNRHQIATITISSSVGFALGVLLAFRNSARVTIQTVDAVLAQRNLSTGQSDITSSRTRRPSRIDEARREGEARADVSGIGGDLLETLERTGSVHYGTRAKK